MSWNIKAKESLKAIGDKIKDMAEDMNDILMVTFIRDILRKAKLMAKATIIGSPLMKYMMDSGKKEFVMAKVFGNETKLILKQAIMIPMLATGKMEKLMASEFILGPMEIDMKDNGSNA